MSIPVDILKNETVILLHGIGHMKWNMFGMERALRKQGYKTLNITYPSLNNELDALTAFLHGRLNVASVWESAGRVHFVTHSMGGLLARWYLEKFKNEIPQEKLGRVVMLAPPNKGSEVADFLKDFPPYRWIFGPAGQELTTSYQEQKTSAPYYGLGIIAGSKGGPYLLGNMAIPGKHDGCVAVARTKLDGMADHIVVPATHGFIAWQPSVHRQVLNFLAHGKFAQEE